MVASWPFRSEERRKIWFFFWFGIRRETRVVRLKGIICFSLRKEKKRRSKKIEGGARKERKK